MPTRYTPKGYKVLPESRKTIRQNAHTILDVLRAQMGLSHPKLPIVTVVEWMDARDVFEFHVVEATQMLGKAAELEPVPGGMTTLTVNEDVYLKACEDDNFGRFTLAHELGHYFLHSRQPIPLTRMQSKPMHRAFEDSEWQANAFAGELLVDSRLVPIHCSCPLDVARVFGVSLETAKIQWEELSKDGLV